MLALFSFESTKLGRIMCLAVIGAVGLGVVKIGGSVSADPPDGNGNHHHGGGVDCSGAGRAANYDLRYSSSSPLDPPYNGDEQAWFNDAIPGFWEPLPFR